LSNISIYTIHQIRKWGVKSKCLAAKGSLVGGADKLLLLCGGLFRLDYGDQFNYSFFWVAHNVPGLGEVGFVVGHVRLENPPCLARVVCCLFYFPS